MGAYARPFWTTASRISQAFRLPRSERAFEHIRSLAQRYSRTKFVSIVGDKCLPNLPDSRVPMIIVYRKGDIRNQIIAWGADRERRLEGENFVGIFEKKITS
jgi:hypothetical protein